MTDANHRTSRPHLTVRELRGAMQLAAQATRGVTAVVEGVHASVWRSLGAGDGVRPERTRGLTGFVYRSIHGVVALVGNSLDVLLGGGL